MQKKSNLSDKHIEELIKVLINTTAELKDARQSLRDCESALNNIAHFIPKKASFFSRLKVFK